MSTLTQTIQEKAKAIIAGGAVLAVGIAEWAVNDPSVGHAIQHVIPAPYNQFVPGLLGVVGTWLVHRVPNAVPTSLTFEEPSTQTSIVRLSQVNGGEFTGTAAH